MEDLDKPMFIEMCHDIKLVRCLLVKYYKKKEKVSEEFVFISPEIN